MWYDFSFARRKIILRFEFKIIMKILLVGEEHRADELRAKLAGATDVEIDFTDGDADEDYKDYDCIFDLNFDDDPSNLSIYASMRDKPMGGQLIPEVSNT